MSVTLTLHALHLAEDRRIFFFFKMRLLLLFFNSIPFNTVASTVTRFLFALNQINNLL